jgi:hypothetical protein
MESIVGAWTKWPYKLIVCGTIIECQQAEEAVALAKLVEVEVCEKEGPKEAETQI